MGAPSARKPRRTGLTTNQRIFSDPASAAAERIRVCEKYGMEIDPRDEAICAAQAAERTDD